MNLVKKETVNIIKSANIAFKECNVLMKKTSAIVTNVIIKSIVNTQKHCQNVVNVGMKPFANMV